MGHAEVAEYLGISKQTLYNWRHRSHKLDFPEPFQELAMGPVWKTKQAGEAVETPEEIQAELEGT